MSAEFKTLKAATADFDSLELTDEYGSWVRVIVKFYDFIFQRASALCPKHWNEQAIKEIAEGGFADGEDFYEKNIKAIEQIFPTFESAWEEFISSWNKLN